MHAVIELPRPMAAIGRPPAPDECPRAVALAEFDRRIENLRCCVHWLVEHEIRVIDSRLCRVGGIVKVAASPSLRVLLGSDCSWRQRRQDGALTIYTWFAMRFGTRIEWEDVSCD
jgi:hypothetical protein